MTKVNPLKRALDDVLIASRVLWDAMSFGMTYGKIMV